MAEPERQERKITRRVFRPTESLFIRDREKGNPYAEGLFNLGAIHLLLIPLALLVREVYSPESNVHHFSGLRTLVGGPWDLLVTLEIFLALFLVSFAVYYCFLGWVVCYRYVGKTANGVFLLLFVAFVVISRYWLHSHLLDINFPPGPRFACCLQQLIFVFKWISFFYENGYKVLHPWHKEDETGPAVWFKGQMEPQIGSFSSYVYFLFCPVLLYRDRYPRKPRNLYKAFSYFCQFVFLVWVCYVILFEFGMPQSMHRDDIRQVAVQNVFLGFLLLLCAHVFMLHCWTNCWAEITGFADCNFYEAWWNAESLLG
jgi:sterol O-acyltransferase